MLNRIEIYIAMWRMRQKIDTKLSEIAHQLEEVTVVCSSRDPMEPISQQTAKLREYIMLLTKKEDLADRHCRLFDEWCSRIVYSRRQAIRKKITRSRLRALLAS